MQLALVANCLLIACGWQPAGADEAFVCGAGGAWRAVAAERGDATLTVRIRPEDTDAGRALVLIRKPEWMTLDDATPPTLRSLAANREPIEIGEKLEVRCDNQGPQLEAALADDANPLTPASLSLRLDGSSFAASRTEGGFPERRLTGVFDLSSLGPGVHEGFLDARDMAPKANSVRLPVRLVIDGIRRHADGQTVTICRGGHEYGAGGRDRGKGSIRLGGTGAAAYLTTEVGGKFVYARNIVASEDLPEGGGIRLTADVIGIDDQDLGQIAELTFDLSTIPEFPGLLVTSRSRNLAADGDVYCFWGWLPGRSYTTSDGDHAWAMEYAPIGKVGWVFLEPETPGDPGIGVISPLPFGESRFGTLLVYTDPKRIPTARGDVVEMKLAFMLADGPAAVAEAHEALTQAGWPGAE